MFKTLVEKTENISKQKRYFISDMKLMRNININVRYKDCHIRDIKVYQRAHHLTGHGLKMGQKLSKVKHEENEGYKKLINNRISEV